MVTVSDDEMISAMRLVAERMKLVLEASSGAALAAALKLKDQEAFRDCKFQKVGVIFCGGNIDIDRLPWICPPAAK